MRLSDYSQGTRPNVMLQCIRVPVPHYSGSGQLVEEELRAGLGIMGTNRSNLAKHIFRVGTDDSMRDMPASALCSRNPLCTAGHGPGPFGDG
jgi:hypothetical protein